MASLDLRELVHRVAVRACADRGRAVAPRAVVSGAAASGSPVSGVHVTVGPSARLGARPHEAAAATARRLDAPRGRELVDVGALDGVPRGGSLAVAPGAIVTALAEDEAARRGIAIVRAAGGVLAGRARATGGSAALAIAVGCDHGGFRLKRAVLEWLRELGHTGVDFGTRDEAAVDYPDFARAVARPWPSGASTSASSSTAPEIGSTMAANKVPGVRAANCWNAKTAANAREHNYANVLALGAGVVAAGEAREVVRTFFSTPEGAARHARRVRKITAIEERYARGGRACSGEGSGACSGGCECGGNA